MMSPPLQAKDSHVERTAHNFRTLTPALE